MDLRLWILAFMAIAFYVGVGVIAIPALRKSLAGFQKHEQKSEIAPAAPKPPASTFKKGAALQAAREGKLKYQQVLAIIDRAG